MRPKSLALLLLALGCGLVASIGITQVMAKKSDVSTPVLDTDPVFIAIKDIPVGEPLNAQLIKLEQWPKDKVPPGALTRIEEVEGLRPRTKLYAGEPILRTKLFGKGAGEPGASPQIPKGLRVVSVKVDAVSGTASLILPGDRVDVLAHLLPNPTAGINEPTTRTVLQNIKVFACDNVVNLENMDGDGKSMAAKTISLLVTPEQAQKVTLATELGQVRLVLRSPEDDQNNDIAGVSSRELFGKAAAGARDKEMAASPTAKPADPDGFLQFLQQSLRDKPKPAGDATPVVQPKQSTQRYTMRLMQGGKSSEVVLEPDPDRPGGDFWKATEQNGAIDPQAAMSAALTAPGPTLEPPAKPGQGDAGSSDGGPKPDSRGKRKSQVKDKESDPTTTSPPKA